MDIMSWIALVQPLILCIIFAGIQHSGVLNSLNGNNRDYVVDTTDFKEQLKQLEDTLVIKDKEFKEVDQSISTLMEAVAAIKSDMDLINSAGNMKQVGIADTECVSNDVLTHVAIVVLAFLQLVTVILMSVLWIKTSNIQMNSKMNDVTQPNDVTQHINNENNESTLSSNNTVATT